MAARPLATPYAGGVPLFMGIAALVCGLSVFAGALRSPDGSLAIAAFFAPQAQSSGADPGTIRTVSGAESAPVRSTAPTMSHGLRLVPAPRQLDVGLSSDDPAGLDRAAMRQATARWTEGWYRAVTGTDGDIRTYLVRASSARWAARWYLAVMAWDDTSGYGAVEVDRAAITVDADGPEDDPRTVLLPHRFLESASAAGPASAALPWSGAPPHPAARLWLAARRGHERGEAVVAERWGTMALPGSTRGRHTRQAVSHTVVLRLNGVSQTRVLGIPAARHDWPKSGPAIGPHGAQRGGALAAHGCVRCVTCWRGSLCWRSGDR